MKKLTRVASAVVGTAILLGVTVPASAAPAPYTYSNTTSVVGTNLVKFTSKITSSTTKTVSKLGICVRDSKGGDRDLPSINGGKAFTLQRGVAYSNTQYASFEPGAYTYGVCFVENGVWKGQSTSANTFTVKQPVTTPTPTPTTPAPTPTPAPNLNAMPTGNIVSDGKNWTQTLAQDFSKETAIGSFAKNYPGWAGYDGWEDTSRNMGRPDGKRGLYDSAKTISVKDSILDVYVRTENGRPLVAALTPQTPEYGQLYGRFAVRWRADSVPGYKVAWLLWPNSENWSDGEIDFPEGDLGGNIDGFSHDVNGNPASNAWSIQTGKSSKDWHTTVIEWSPNKLRYIIDGVAYETTNKAAIPQKAMHWVLQTETQLSSTAPSATAKGHVEIDWVAAYKLN